MSGYREAERIKELRTFFESKVSDKDDELNKARETLKTQETQLSNLKAEISGKSEELTTLRIDHDRESKVL